MTVKKEVLRTDQHLGAPAHPGLKRQLTELKCLTLSVCFGENSLPVPKLVMFLPLCCDCNNSLNWDVKAMKQPFGKNVCDGKLLCTDEYAITHP